MLFAERRQRKRTGQRKDGETLQEQNKSSDKENSMVCKANFSSANTWIHAVKESVENKKMEKEIHFK